jgi:hypothetical protein
MQFRHLRHPGVDGKIVQSLPVVGDHGAADLDHPALGRRPTVRGLLLNIARLIALAVARLAFQPRRRFRPSPLPAAP